MKEIKKCQQCEKELSGRQTVFCSNDCKLKNKDNIALRTKPKEKLDPSLMVVCKKTGKSFKDYKNYSGVLTRHVKTLGIELDSIENHFDIVHNSKSDKPKYQCKYCSWTSVDVENKSGCITVHIKSKHNLDPSYHIENYPDEAYLFIFNNRNKKREEFFMDNPTSYIKCEICKKIFKKLTNSHLESHGITPDQYRIKYKIEILSSEDTMSKCKDALGKGRDILIDKNISKTSGEENDIKDFLISLGVSFRQSVRGLIYPLEVDFYLPEHKLAIEYDGLAWHSERFGKKPKGYHLEKLRKCEEKGVRLFTIFGDEWLNKNEIVKNKIINALGLNQDRIFASKCKIKEIETYQKNYFLNTYHIQGEDKSNINLALFYKDKIVSVMTFCTPRIIMGYKDSDTNIYELSRFASSTNVVGAGSKLLSFFIKNYSPSSIFSFADRRYTSIIKESIYDRLGFKRTKINPPTFWVLKNHRRRYHRFTFNKKRLIEDFGADPQKTEVQNMFELGFDRIWDCGTLKYEMLLR